MSYDDILSEVAAKYGGGTLPELSTDPVRVPQIDVPRVDAGSGYDDIIAEVQQKYGGKPRAIESEDPGLWDTYVKPVLDSTPVRAAVGLLSGFSDIAGGIAEEAKAAASGVQSRVRLSPEGIQQYAEEAGASSAPVSPWTIDVARRGYEVPGVEQIAKEGIAQGLSGAAGALGFDPGLTRADLSRAGGVEGPRGVAAAIAEGVGEFALGLGTDPISGAYLKANRGMRVAQEALAKAEDLARTAPGLAEVAAREADDLFKAAKAEEWAAKQVDLGTGLAAIPAIGGQALEQGQAAYEEYRRNGLTPAAAEAATQAALGLLGVGMVGADARDVRRSMAERQRAEMAPDAHVQAFRTSPDVLSLSPEQQAGIDALRGQPEPRGTGPDIPAIEVGDLWATEPPTISQPATGPVVGVDDLNLPKAEELVLEDQARAAEEARLAETAHYQMEPPPEPPEPGLPDVWQGENPLPPASLVPTDEAARLQWAAEQDLLAQVQQQRAEREAALARVQDVRARAVAEDVAAGRLGPEVAPGVPAIEGDLASLIPDVGLQDVLSRAREAQGYIGDLQARLAPPRPGQPFPVREAAAGLADAFDQANPAQQYPPGGGAEASRLAALGEPGATFEDIRERMRALRERRAQAPVQAPPKVSPGSIPVDETGVRVLPGEEHLSAAEREAIDVATGESARQAKALREQSVRIHSQMRERILAAAGVLESDSEAIKRRKLETGAETVLYEEQSRGLVDPNTERLVDLALRDVTRETLGIKARAPRRLSDAEVLAGTPLEGVDLSVKEIEKALRDDKGNRTEMRIREMVRENLARGGEEPPPEYSDEVPFMARRPVRQEGPGLFDQPGVREDQPVPDAGPLFREEPAAQGGTVPSDLGQGEIVFAQKDGRWKAGDDLPSSTGWYGSREEAVAALQEDHARYFREKAAKDRAIRDEIRVSSTAAPGTPVVEPTATIEEGQFQLTRGKVRAVDPNDRTLASNWHETEAAARKELAEFRASRVRGEQAKGEFAAAIVRAKAGEATPADITTISNGRNAVTTAQAHEILRDMGIRGKTGEQVARRVGSWISSGGYTMLDPGEVVAAGARHLRAESGAAPAAGSETPAATTIERTKAGDQRTLVSALDTTSPIRPASGFHDSPLFNPERAAEERRLEKAQGSLDFMERGSDVDARLKEASRRVRDAEARARVPVGRVDIASHDEAHDAVARSLAQALGSDAAEAVRRAVDIVSKQAAKALGVASPEFAGFHVDSAAFGYLLDQRIRLGILQELDTAQARAANGPRGVGVEKYLARGIVNIVAHEAAHMLEKGHGPAHVAAIKKVVRSIAGKPMVAIRARLEAAFASRAAALGETLEQAREVWGETRRGDSGRAGGDDRGGATEAGYLGGGRARPSPGGEGRGPGLAGAVPGGVRGPAGGVGSAPERGRGGADVVKTEAFRRWFTGSKVIGKGGGPLVVYHGTTAPNFGAFEGDATFFTDSPDIAGGVYAEGRSEPNVDAFGEALAGMSDAKVRATVERLQRTGLLGSIDETGPDLRADLVAQVRGRFDADEGTGQPSDVILKAFRVEPRTGVEGSRVVPAYLALKNPLTIDAKGDEYDAEVQAGWLQRARQGGHDGLIVRNYHDGGYGAPGSFTSAGRHTVYVAFRPEQIKSAIGNRGTFDPENPDMSAMVRQGYASGLSHLKGHHRRPGSAKSAEAVARDEAKAARSAAREREAQQYSDDYAAYVARIQETGEPYRQEEFLKFRAERAGDRGASFSKRQTAAERRAAELEQFRQQAQRMRGETAGEAPPAGGDRASLSLLRQVPFIEPLDAIEEGAKAQSMDRARQEVAAGVTRPVVVSINESGRQRVRITDGRYLMTAALEAGATDLPLRVQLERNGRVSQIVGAEAVRELTAALESTKRQERRGQTILDAMDRVKPMASGGTGQSPSIGVPELWEATRGQFRDRAEFDRALFQLQRDGKIGTERGDTGLSAERFAASTVDPTLPTARIMAVHKLASEPSFKLREGPPPTQKPDLKRNPDGSLAFDDPPRVEGKVEDFYRAARDAGIKDLDLKRDHPKTWESQIPDVRRTLAEPNAEARLLKKATTGRLTDTDVLALDALRDGYREQFERLKDERAKAADPGAVNAQIIDAAFRTAAVEYARVAKSDVQAGTSLGRALAARRAVMQGLLKTKRLASAPDAFLDKLFKELPDVTPEQAAELARIATSNRPELLADALHAYVHPAGPRQLAWWLELWKASILSGPGTQVANISGSVVEVPMRVGETLTSAAVDAIVSRLTGADRTRYSGEAGSELRGAVKGAKAGLPQLVADLKDIIHARPERVNLDDRFEYQVGNIGGKKGRIIRTPFRLLRAADNFFRSLGRGAELGKLAWREAERELGKAAGRDAIRKRAAEISEEALRDDTGPKWQQLLEDVSRGETSRVFQDDPAGIVHLLLRARAQYPVLHFVLPFVQTPANIASLTLERLGGGFLGARKTFKMLAQAKAAGAPEADIARLRGQAMDELARPTFGLAILTALAGAAAQGILTGSGPTDQEEKAAKRETGWQPYSLKIDVGNGRAVFIPYNRLEPASSLIGIAADIVESKDSRKATDLFAKGMSSIAQNITSKSYLEELSNAVELIHDPARSVRGFVAGLAGSLVPNIVAAGTRAIDPAIRDVAPETAGLAGTPDAAWRKIVSRIPGASFSLPQRLGPTGEAIDRPGTAVERFLLPSQVSATKAGKEVEAEIARVGGKAAPGAPGRDMVVGPGKKVRLTDEEYALLGEGMQKAADRVRKLMASPTYENLPDTEDEGGSSSKEAKIKRIWDQAREESRARVRKLVLRRLAVA